jgi:hypothetical protein
MYAFRKPFNAATFNNLQIAGFDLKDVLIVSQILGYMCSKFIGIKVISELTSQSRSYLTFVLIGISAVGLLLFAIVPLQFKPFCLFINGLPLGMVWGVVFSFLEGRRLTELIATGIAVGALIASGVVKSIARWVLTWDFLMVNEFWMPLVTGLMFFPVLILSVWMLNQLPPPNTRDNAAKVIRVPLNRSGRIELLERFGLGLFLLVAAYISLTIFRDFRDNFSVEILNELGYFEVSQYAQMELVLGLIVTFTTAFAVIFRDNLKGFFFCLLLILIGFCIMLISYFLFHSGKIDGWKWVMYSGIGMSIGYVPFQIVLFERFIALFRIKANAGFFMYICDSFGYLGSISLLFFRQWYGQENWVHFFGQLNMITAVSGMVLMLLIALHFFKKVY